MQSALQESSRRESNSIYTVCPASHRSSTSRTNEPDKGFLKDSPKGHKGRCHNRKGNSCWTLCGSLTRSWSKCKQHSTRKTTPTGPKNSPLLCKSQLDSPRTLANDQHNLCALNNRPKNFRLGEFFTRKNGSSASCRTPDAFSNSPRVAFAQESSTSVALHIANTQHIGDPIILRSATSSVDQSRDVIVKHSRLDNSTQMNVPVTNSGIVNPSSINSKSSQTVTGSPEMMAINTVNEKNEQNATFQCDHTNLTSSIECCEKRLEQLYDRLLSLQSPTSTHSPEVPHRISPGCVPHSEDSTLAFTSLNPPEKQIGDCPSTDLTDVEHRINEVSEKLSQLKCYVESYAYLSWLGVAHITPYNNHVFTPGRRAPPPNPQLSIIRKSDIECQAIIHEYHKLCSSPISEKIRMELRLHSFNNWPWSDAWLIRFVRQMFIDLEFVSLFELPLDRLDTWLCDVYRRYNRVPFHNYKHAFMVTQMAYVLIWEANLTENLEKLEQMILLVSAISHDLDHPGFNNAYQINAGTELAIRYNDQSPLENHHSAMAFDVLSHPESNPFDHLEEHVLKRMREGIIRCILATDMSRHNDIVNQFNTVVLGDLEAMWTIDCETNRPKWAVEKSSLNLVMMILIKVSDISNESRPLHVAGPWINRLLTEFFHQSDYEKLAGLPVAPFMDREKVTKSASQCGFIRFVILPLFEALSKLFPPLKDIILQSAIDQLNYYTDMQLIEEQQGNQADM
ncbi:hypothetical protein EG68_02767 [Paragonimus skrjabini miyazakii]|uniref:Phosphodiesterase n=1 Tax=Paragonimus skrjabini miyazakii TaxID=59628 RepID=A0A8S9YXT2_9TREM|nr:hypothetical protein EG68_02767 [Paragonimus skrjabini miyazakii]